MLYFESRKIIKVNIYIFMTEDEIKEEMGEDMDTGDMAPTDGEVTSEEKEPTEEGM